jgi:hypothetical protein
MRFCRFILCLLFCLTASRFAHTQTVRRDSEAISILTTAINALGGPPSAKSIASCTVTGQAEIFKGGTQSGPLSSFVETATLNGHFWDFTLHVVQGSHVKDVGRQSGKSVTTRDGSPVTLPNSPPASHPPFYLPTWLFANVIADSSYSIIDLGVDMRGGVPRRHVQLVPWVKGHPELYLRQDWIFDKDHFLPVEVDYIQAPGSRIETAAPKRVLLGDFTKINGQPVASTLQYYSGAALNEQRTIESVSIGQQTGTSNSAVTGGGH